MQFIGNCTRPRRLLRQPFCGVPGYYTAPGICIVIQPHIARNRNRVCQLRVGFGEAGRCRCVGRRIRRYVGRCRDRRIRRCVGERGCWRRGGNKFADKIGQGFKICTDSGKRNNQKDKQKEKTFENTGQRSASIPNLFRHRLYFSGFHQQNRQALYEASKHNNQIYPIFI